MSDIAGIHEYNKTQLVNVNNWKENSFYFTFITWNTGDPQIIVEE